MLAAAPAPARLAYLKRENALIAWDSELTNLGAVAAMLHASFGLGQAVGATSTARMRGTDASANTRGKSCMLFLAATGLLLAACCCFAIMAIKVSFYVL